LFPAPLLSVHDLLVVYVCQEDQVVFSLLYRTSATPLAGEGSVTLSASVAVRLFMLAAPLFIVTVPMGLSLSTLTFLGAEATDVLPASSVVLAV